jgi:DNA-cytosine methyltransferase
MKVLSLFDGISCGLQALKELNIKVDKYYSSEIDEDAIKISEKNHPEIIRIGNINNIDFNLYKDIDLILAGSPCQGFSTQGKLLGLEDPRSKLFYKFIEALNIIKPKFFLLENVVMKKEWLEIINKETGVNGFYLSSKYFSAQDRKRYYWTNISFEKYNIEDLGIKFKDIQDLEANLYYSEEDIEKLKNISWQTTKTYIKNTDKYMNNKYPTLWGKFYGHGNIPFVKIDNKYRLLSILECERLQTLPDNYTNIKDLNNTRRYVTISNAWNVATIKHIFKGLIK